MKKKYIPVAKKVVKQVAPLVFINATISSYPLNIVAGAFISAAYRVALALGGRGKKIT